MLNVVIDLESIPGSPWYQEKLAANVAPPANYKSADAIDKWWKEKGEAKKAEAHKQAALSPYCQIVCICYRIEGQDDIRRFYSNDEKKLLERFIESLRADLHKDDYKQGAQSHHMPKWVGHNVAGFDLPRLFQRLKVHDLHTIPFHIPSPAQMKTWDSDIFDTLAHWCGRDTKGNSLSNVCTEFGIVDLFPEMDGSMVYDLYLNDELEKIADYCANDVQMAYELSKKLGLWYAAE